MTQEWEPMLTREYRSAEAGCWFSEYRPPYETLKRGIALGCYRCSEKRANSSYGLSGYKAGGRGFVQFSNQYSSGMAVGIVVSIGARQLWGAAATLSEQASDDQVILLLLASEQRERRPAEVGSLVTLTSLKSVEEVGVVGNVM
jgi:hypothetical protein